LQSSEDSGNAEDGQEVDNESTTNQDSSSDDNVLQNDNDFGDDITAIGQDNEADEDAANVGVQDQDVTQEEDQIQEATNTNVDFDVQVGLQVERPPSGDNRGEEPPADEGFCLDFTIEGNAFSSCLESLADCEGTQAVLEERGAIITEECHQVL
jgi:hypothetical protein